MIKKTVVPKIATENGKNISSNTSFVKKILVKRQIGFEYGKQKPHKCPVCDTGFTERGNLKKHIASVHEK